MLDANEDAALASAQDALAAFGPQFEAAYLGGLRRKLGLATEREGDAALMQDLLARMAANRADFTLTFRGLCGAAAGPEGDATVRALFTDPGAYDDWAARWRARLADEPAAPAERAAAMRAVNPAIIPRNYLVEAALDAALQREDLEPFEKLLAALEHPFEDAPPNSPYATRPVPAGTAYQTFCGT